MEQRCNYGCFSLPVCGSCAFISDSWGSPPPPPLPPRRLARCERGPFIGHGSPPQQKPERGESSAGRRAGGHVSWLAGSWRQSRSLSVRARCNQNPPCTPLHFLVEKKQKHHFSTWILLTSLEVQHNAFHVEHTAVAADTRVHLLSCYVDVQQRSPLC